MNDLKFARRCHPRLHFRVLPMTPHEGQEWAESGLREARRDRGADEVSRIEALLSKWQKQDRPGGPEDGWTSIGN